MNILHEIEKDNIQKNELIIYYLGQSGYVLKSKYCIVYIDPYLSDFIQNPNGLNDSYMTRNYLSPIEPKNITKCDAILCTHSHVDHMDPWTINNINTGFNFYCSIGAYEKSSVNYPTSKTIFLEPGKKVFLDNFIIEAIPAAHYHLKDIHGRSDCLSFIIKYNDIRLFFWGDGIPYVGQETLLSELEFDYFFAPINGRDKHRESFGIVGNLNEYELANICKKIKIKNVIPNHFDMFKNNTGSQSIFLELLNKINPKQKVIILEYGEKFKA